MEASEAIIIVLILVIVVYLAAKAAQKGSSKSAGGRESMDAGSAWDGRRTTSLTQALADQRAWQNQHIASRVGVRNDSAGYSAWRQPNGSAGRAGLQWRQNPIDRELAEVRSRNGNYLPPSVLSRAESQAWGVGPTDGFDPQRGHSVGALTEAGDGDWSNELSSLVLDPRTKQNHMQWVREVAPFSQGAMTVDNLDEAVVMSMPRQGITSFRFAGPAQGPCTQQITENDAALHAEHLKKLYF